VALSLQLKAYRISWLAVHESANELLHELQRPAGRLVGIAGHWF